MKKQRIKDLDRSLDRALAADDELATFTEFISDGLQKFTLAEKKELFILASKRTAKSPEEAGALAIIIALLEEDL